MLSKATAAPAHLQLWEQVVAGAGAAQRHKGHLRPLAIFAVLWRQQQLVVVLRGRLKGQAPPDAQLHGRRAHRAAGYAALPARKGHMQPSANSSMVIAGSWNGTGIGCQCERVGVNMCRQRRRQCDEHCASVHQSKEPVAKQEPASHPWHWRSHCTMQASW